MRYPPRTYEKLKGFYEKVFGWKIVKHPPVPGVDMEYWSIQTVPIDEKGMLLRPGVNGGMYKKEMAGAIPVSYVAVEDIDRALKEAKRLGAKIVSDKAEIPTIGKFAIVLDPEGNPIGIMQPAMI